MQACECGAHPSPRLTCPGTHVLLVSRNLLKDLLPVLESLLASPAAVWVEVHVCTPRGRHGSSEATWGGGSDVTAITRQSRP